MSQIVSPLVSHPNRYLLLGELGGVVVDVLQVDDGRGRGGEPVPGHIGRLQRQVVHPHTLRGGKGEALSPPSSHGDEVSTPHHGWPCARTNPWLLQPRCPPKCPPSAPYLSVEAGPCGADLSRGGVDAEHAARALLQDGEPQRRVVRLGVIGIGGLHRHHAGPCGHRSAPGGCGHRGRLVSPPHPGWPWGPTWLGALHHAPREDVLAEERPVVVLVHHDDLQVRGVLQCHAAQVQGKSLQLGAQSGWVRANGGGWGPRVHTAGPYPYPKSVVLLPVQHGVEEDLAAELVDGEDAQGLLVHPRTLDAVDHPPRLLLVRLDLPRGKQGWGWGAGGWGLPPGPLGSWWGGCLAPRAGCLGWGGPCTQGNWGSIPYVLHGDPLAGGALCCPP